ncbi:MAG TPA: hypothetical protein DCZ92_12040 [Elusimicrobia bacterium]|nr:hypothetical protein [Elusimicrobiota bacterium]
MMRSGLFILLLLAAAVPVFAQGAGPDAELVFYDSMEHDASGAQVLKGGVYKDPAQGARLREKSLSAPVPADGYYHIRYVVDARSRARAEDYVRLFLSNPAFSSVADRFRIEYAEGDPELMNCRNDNPASPRIIRCNMDYILSLATAPVHMTGVFTSRGSGGAGGAGVTIVSLNYPLNTMLHESLHTWGLNDEYEYSPSEADYYCNNRRILKGPNTSSFPVREAYASDAEARNLHRGDISWLEEIAAAPIVYGAPAGADPGAGTVFKLGTPSSSPVNEPGLYGGSNCSRKMPSFRPYKADTIMKTLSTTWIPPIHQKAVLAAIAKAAGW